MRAYQVEEVLSKRSRADSDVVFAGNHPDFQVHRERDTVVIRLMRRQMCRHETVETRGVRTTTGSRADATVLALETACAGVGVAVIAVAAANGSPCYGGGGCDEDSFYLAAAGAPLATGCGVSALVDAMAGDQRVDEVQLESRGKARFRPCDLALAHADVELVIAGGVRRAARTDERAEARIELTSAQWEAAGPSPTFTLIVDGKVLRRKAP